MKRLLSSLIMFAAVGCGGVGGGGSDYPKDDLRKNKQPAPPANFYIDADDIMEFDEGQPAEYKVQGVVPEPGTPILTVERLPEGAILKDGLIKWAPPVNTSLGLTEVQRGYTTQRIRFTLKSSADETSQVQKSVLMFVRIDQSQHNLTGR